MKLPALLIIFFGSLLLIAPGMAIDADQQKESLIRNGDFEQWEWQEFSDAQRKAVKGWLAKGKKLKDVNLEIRGPLHRGLVGYGESTGTMVEGKEAFQGRSLYLRAEEEELAWGLHWMLLKQLCPEASYAYDVCLKGKGKFSLRAWIPGTSVDGATFKWLGFPDLFTLTPTNNWQRYQGTFKMPNLGNAGFAQEKAMVAMILAAGSSITIDELKLWETH